MGAGWDFSAIRSDVFSQEGRKETPRDGAERRIWGDKNKVNHRYLVGIGIDVIVVQDNGFLTLMRHDHCIHGSRRCSALSWGSRNAQRVPMLI